MKKGDLLRKHAVISRSSRTFGVAIVCGFCVLFCTNSTAAALPLDSRPETWMAEEGGVLGVASRNLILQVYPLRNGEANARRRPICELRKLSQGLRFLWSSGRRPKDLLIKDFKA